MFEKRTGLGGFIENKRAKCGEFIEKKSQNSIVSLMSLLNSTTDSQKVPSKLFMN